MSDGAPVLRVDGVRKFFGGVRAVDGVSVALARGEIRALIGPNGAGKSTLFNILTGQLTADAGAVTFRGERISGLPPYAIWRRGVSRTFQITATFATLSVLENVQAARLSHAGRSLNLAIPAHGLERDRSYALLEHVGLRQQAARPAGVLAYGDLKKLELAIALANDPALLLLDEPTAGMAPAERGALMALTARIARERDLTVLFTEHDMDVVFAVADRIMVLHQGRVIADGAPADVRANREVQAVYLGLTRNDDGTIRLGQDRRRAQRIPSSALDPDRDEALRDGRRDGGDPKNPPPQGQAHHRSDRGPGPSARLDRGNHNGRPGRPAMRRRHRPLILRTTSGSRARRWRGCGSRRSRTPRRINAPWIACRTAATGRWRFRH